MGIKCVFVLGFALLSLSAFSFEVEDFSISKKQERRLLNGEILIEKIKSSKKKWPTYIARSIIKGKLDEALNILLDFEKYSKFFPQVEKVEVRKKEKNYFLLQYKLGLPLGKIKRYRLGAKFSKRENRFQLKWKLVPWPELKPDETIVDSVGHWIVKKYSDDKIMILYKLYTDPGHIPWGLGWIVSRLTGKSLPDVLRALDSRIKKLYYFDKSNLSSVNNRSNKSVKKN